MKPNFHKRFHFLFLLLLSITLSSPANAQRMDNNTIHLGVGLTRHNGPKVYAASVYGEYSKPFFPRSVVGVSASTIFPVDVSTVDEKRTLRAYRFGMNLYYEVLDERKQQLKVGAGYAAGFFKTDWQVLVSGLSGTNSDFQPGFAALLEYNFIFNQVFILGFACKAFLFDNEKSGFFLGLHSGYRF